MRPDGTLVQDVDTTLSEGEKNDLLLAALHGAHPDVYAGERVVRFQNQIILKKQVTHLGNPWPGFKKRIQIPKAWLAVERRAVAEGLVPRFVGIYHYEEVTIFVDFDPSTYVQRRANNSAAHVSTNDLYQAQTLGMFSRKDRNRNHLTSVRFDEFAGYLQGTLIESRPRVAVFDRFNGEFLASQRVEAVDAITEMHAANWPDTFQAEWPGFYLEFRMDRFLRRHGDGMVEFQKVKKRNHFDYDLVFKDGDLVQYYGDLKASNLAMHESPGNDAEDFKRCLAEFGRFWYVIYEHETWHARNNANLATTAWNQWKRSVGHQGKKPYDPLSYASRFKEAVRFVRMSILEVNEANIHVVLRDFRQGQQPDGAARALKVMINKRNIDNFLIFSSTVD